MKALQLPTPELVDALRRSDSDWPIRAAVGLLIEHARWLENGEFRESLSLEAFGGLLFASVEWAEACRLADSDAGTEVDRAVLRVACSLAGYTEGGRGDDGPAPWSVKGMLWPLDLPELRAVVTAVALASIGGRA